jgi:hypothetical protein
MADRMFKFLLLSWSRNVLLLLADKSNCPIRSHAKPFQLRQYLNYTCLRDITVTSHSSSDLSHTHTHTHTRANLLHEDAKPNLYDVLYFSV